MKDNPKQFPDFYHKQLSELWALLILFSFYLIYSSGHVHNFSYDTDGKKVIQKKMFL